MNRTFSKFPPFLSLSAFALTFLLPTSPAQSQEYHRVNLVSDIPGVALRSDPHLVNPWGIAFLKPVRSGSLTTVLELPHSTSVTALRLPILRLRWSSRFPAHRPEPSQRQPVWS